MKKLGEVLNLEYGKALQEGKRRAGGYPVVGSNGIVGYHDTYIVKAPCIIVGRKGSAGKVTDIEKDCYPIDTTFYNQIGYQCQRDSLRSWQRNLTLLVDNKRVNPMCLELQKGHREMR
ncbi:restriction endonuclease subunit S [Helicobacter sp. L8]|uniref:restriction endonuclease subunit S n=1 Tax=Helicobacter sp. L8 TaxID=2316078 RepID=UPI001F0A0055|nr:restriction endonuclease subunit S [Helicobacter sp. L8]